MDDPAKAIVAISFFGSIAYSVRSIAGAYARRGLSDKPRRDAVSGDTEARLARIEQAVEAIAIEVERVSEGQRFTTKLLSQRAESAPNERGNG